MKKLSLLLALIMILCIPVAFAFGEEEQSNETAPATGISAVYNQDTNLIEVTLSIKNNPGIYNFDSILQYDGSLVKVVQIDKYNLLVGECIEDVDNHTRPDDYNFLWFDMSQNHPKVTTDGKLVKVYFEILEDADTYTFSYSGHSEEDNAGKAEVISFESSSVSIEVFDYEDDCTIYYAQYDDNGKMVSIRDVEYSEYLDLKDSIGQNDKLFIIENETYMPVCDSYSFSSHEYAWPNGLSQVTIVVPQAQGALLDQSTRILADYLSETYPDTTFTVVNNQTSGGNQASAEFVSAAYDGSVLMAHSFAPIMQYYSGIWENNLADTSKYKVICSDVGQLQPVGGVFLINSNETRFTDIPTLVQYVNDHPNEVRFSYGTGTSHMIEMRLITDYYGISDLVKWVTGSSTDVRSWIKSGDTDVAILTNSTACDDVRSGAVVGILSSLVDRNYGVNLMDILDNVPIISNYVSDRATAESLVCDWPNAIYGPASMSDELAEQINAACAGIISNQKYMAEIKSLDLNSTYQVLSTEELDEMLNKADSQVKRVYENMK